MRPLTLPILAFGALASCGDGAPPDAAVTPADAAVTPDAGPSAGRCLSLEGAAALLPAEGRHTAPHEGLNVVADPARGGVVLSPRLHPGPWVEAGETLPRGAHDSDGDLYDGRLYVLGGQQDRFNGEASLLVSTLDADGRAGPWRTATPFMFGIIDHIVLAHAGRMYLTGGGQSLGNDSFRQQVASWFVTPGEGDLTPWQRGPDNPRRRFGHEAVIARGFLYTLVGDDGFDAHDDVSVAALLPDGSIGPWRVTTPVPEGALQFIAGAATSRNIWVLGGCRRKNCQLRANIERRVWVADIGNDGTLSAWRSAGELPVPNYDQKAVMVGGRIVMAGGREGGNSRCGDVGGANYRDVWWAEVNPDGGLGAWQGGAAEGAAMPRSRSDFILRRDHQNNLWIVGGRTACDPGESAAFNTNYPRTVWRSALETDPGRARIGAWTSGPLAVAGRTLEALSVDASGPGVRVRFRVAARAAPNTWSDWSDAVETRALRLPPDTATVQVEAELEGDGTDTGVFRGLSLSCAAAPSP